MTMSGKGLTQSWNISVQLQLVITSKVPNSLDPDQVRTEFPVWSGSKLFERVISRWQPSKHAYMGPIWATHMAPIWGVQTGSAWVPCGLAHMRVAKMGPIWVPYNSPIKKKEMI